MCLRMFYQEKEKEAGNFSRRKLEMPERGSLGRRVGSEQPNHRYTDSRKAGAKQTFITLSVIHSTQAEALVDTQ